MNSHLTETLGEYSFKKKGQKKTHFLIKFPIKSDRYVWEKNIRVGWCLNAFDTQAMLPLLTVPSVNMLVFDLSHLPSALISAHEHSLNCTTHFYWFE